MLKLSINNTKPTDNFFTGDQKLDHKSEAPGKIVPYVTDNKNPIAERDFDDDLANDLMNALGISLKPITIATKMLSKLATTESFPDHDWCLMATGSDARNEKNQAVSPDDEGLELIFFGSNHSVVSVKNRIEEFIKSKPRLFYKELEAKFLTQDDQPDGDDPLDTDVLRIGEYDSIPTRALDAVFIYGDTSLFRIYKQTFAKQLNSIKIKNFHEKLILPARVKIKNPRKHKCIDYKNGTLIYNKECRATKYAHLRATQYKIACEIFAQIHMGNIKLDDIMILPSNTLERFDWIKHSELRNDNFNPDLIDKIKQAYQEALEWYHESQRNFCQKRKEELSVSIDNLKEVTKTLKEFSSRGTKIFKNS